MPPKSTAPRQRYCEAPGCGLPLLGGQKRVHHVCDPQSIVGRRCICRPGCTSVRWGDGGCCDPKCEPCQTMAGRPHKLETKET